MPKISTYKVQVPIYGEVEYVSIQYDDNFAVSMPKADYEALPVSEASLEKPAK